MVVSGSRLGMLSQHEKVTGEAFDRQIGSTKGRHRYADSRIRTGSVFDRHNCYATGDCKWPAGKSRFNWYKVCQTYPLVVEFPRLWGSVHGRGLMNEINFRNHFAFNQSAVGRIWHKLLI